MSDSNTVESPCFNDLNEVSAKTRLGKSTILAWESQGRFPKAIRLSKTRRLWLERDVHAWMLELHAAAKSAIP